MWKFGKYCWYTRVISTLCGSVRLLIRLSHVYKTHMTQTKRLVNSTHTVSIFTITKATNRKIRDIHVVFIHYKKDKEYQNTRLAHDVNEHMKIKIFLAYSFLIKGILHPYLVFKSSWLCPCLELSPLEWDPEPDYFASTCMWTDLR